MPLFEKTVNDIVTSHDELISVCQALMSVILENDLTSDMEVALRKLGVEPGFAERADAARRVVCRERIQEVRDGIIN